MAWTIRRRIKVIPGIHFNLSRSGISTSIGVRGASLTVGKSGTYLHTGIPGTGIYQRQKLNKKSSSYNQSAQYEQDFAIEKEITSSDVRQITSHDMQEFKKSILLARQQRIELQKDLNKLSWELVRNKIKLLCSYIFLYGFVWKEHPKQIKKKITFLKESTIEVRKDHNSCYVNLEINFDKDFREKYDNLLEAFKKVCSSQKIWDVTSQKTENTVITRSSAGTLVKKNEVRFGLKNLEDIKTKYEALFFQNANGADIYIYPNFITIFSTKENFAIVGFEELEFIHHSVRFVETNPVPKDAEVVGQTWAMVNKNGTRDKRFKGNYQIPLVKYGQFKFSTKSGLNEEYQVSNYEASCSFAEAFKEYQSLITSSSSLEKN